MDENRKKEDLSVLATALDLNDANLTDTSEAYRTLRRTTSANSTYLQFFAG